MHFPSVVPNMIAGKEQEGIDGLDGNKFAPADGSLLCRFVRSGKLEVDMAVAAALEAQKGWGSLPAPRRGEILFDMVRGMEERKADIAHIVARETGKAPKEALGETLGAIALGRFFAAEGQRLYGRTLQSSVAHKYSHTIRQPRGVAGLIVAANTPIANVAWKVFPALICGNAAVLKMAEDTPATAWIMGQIASEAGLPPGVLNIIQGYGREAGAPLVEHPDVNVISFTGSATVGRWIAEVCGRRLARVSLELGGKNPLVVCDDADLDNAIRWALLSAFSNAGQRCAAASRLIVFASVYDEFRERFLDRVKSLRVGPTDEDDLGPVINLRQLNAMCDALTQAKEQGVTILAGGGRLDGPQWNEGYYMEPTVYENAAAGAPISQVELFGPITGLYRAKDLPEAVHLANSTQYGLTAAIHTNNIHRATCFSQQAKAGVVMINAGTYGSEPHFPFGGFGASGNGSREPGVEALDVYSELKAIHSVINPNV